MCGYKTNVGRYLASEYNAAWQAAFDRVVYGHPYGFAERAVVDILWVHQTDGHTDGPGPLDFDAVY